MALAASAKLPRSLWILFASLFVNRFGSFVHVFLVLYMISRGYTLTQAGVAVSASGIGSIGASVSGGIAQIGWVDGAPLSSRCSLQRQPCCPC